MRKYTEKGISLVEMIVYISVLTIVLLFVTNTLLSFTSSYRNLTALRAADHGGMDSMERLTRSIRAASSINVASSTFAVSNGVLTLTSTSNSFSTTTKFYLQNGTIKIDVNGVYYGPLTASDVTVTSMTFYRLSTSTSEAVKIDMTLNGLSGNVSKTKNFHSTIVIKGL